MRAFVALDLPPFTEPFPSGIRPEDHLTLHFFDELPPERIPDTVGAMRDAAGGTGPFEVEIRGLGAFPNLQRPRVLWAGVNDGSTEIQRLAGRLRTALAARGYSTEQRAFIPHLTLARLRSSRASAWAIRLLAEPELASRVWTRARISELLLKESELLPAGPRHTVRAKVPLGASPPAPSGT
jgi:RNA 2',3'-cyclic 3'-phosphodiesterase